MGLYFKCLIIFEQLLSKDSLFPPTLQSMVVELCSGPCVAMEIRGSDAPTAFRQCVGPADPVSTRNLSVLLKEVFV